jgi:uncharacterized protein YyaL (SSP411 family)
MIPERGINWVEWTDEAFQRAKRESKPILLDISAVWCHWCHRLDQDTYSVPEIVEYVESHFVPIRVDTDKRPDINRRYNMGGWPTTAFLTPDGTVIGGGTYYPPDQMRQILRDVYSVWEKTKGETTPKITPPESEVIPIGDISNSIIDEVLGEVANNFDRIYGGFGSQPKFPSTDAHELALLKYHYTGNREILKIASLTLHNVGKNGLFDSEMGGFFRYSTVRDWSIPHYEKMSEDNAKWLSLYLHAYQATGEQFYADIARSIIGYVLAWLSDQEKGCFFGSQDADEEYYRLSKDERARTKAPYVDKHIYTNWNALMISSFFEASYVLEDDSIREFGMKSLGRLMSLNYSDGNGMYHFYDNEPHLLNQLEDQMQTIRTLGHAYELTGERNFILKAEELMQIATSKLYDEQNGGFFDIAVDHGAPGFLKRPAKPLDENSVAARVLVKLHHLTGNESYRKTAEETLKQFVEIFPQFGFMAADYALAIDAFLNEPPIIRVVGSPERRQTKELLAESHRIYEPRKIIQPLNPDEDAQYISELGYPNTKQPTAFVCLGKLCAAPITDPKDIPSVLAKLSRPT